LVLVARGLFKISDGKSRLPIIGSIDDSFWENLKLRLINRKQPHKENKNIFFIESDLSQKFLQTYKYNNTQKKRAFFASRLLLMKTVATEKQGNLLPSY
jgi:hypothetical protein